MSNHFEYGVPQGFVKCTPTPLHFVLHLFDMECMYECTYFGDTFYPMSVSGDMDA